MSGEVTRKASSGAAGAPRKRAEQGPVVKAYLVAYNVASMAGWAYVILQIVQYFARHSDVAGAVFNQTAADNLFNDIQGPLKLVQTAAFLEVLHASFGLVRAPVVTTAIQGASKFVPSRRAARPGLRGETAPQLTAGERSLLAHLAN